MDINERIKIRRKELGLSAEVVAEKLGVSPATIYRYESKEIKKFPTKILKPLATVLHTTPAFLMGWNDEELNVDENSIKLDLINEINKMSDNEVLSLYNLLQEFKNQNTSSSD